MELTPEQKFNAEPPEKMIPRMFAEGFDREAIIDTLIQLNWEPEEAAYLVDAHIAKLEDRTPPPRPQVTYNTPAAITVLCAFGFAGAAMTAVAVVSPATWENQFWFPLSLVASIVIKAICYTGLLRMRRWAMVAYAVFFVTLQIPVWISGYWNPESCIFSMGILATGTAYWSQMK
jgi:hypothetical protein